MTRPRVLVLDEEVPIPPNTGKRIRTLNLLTQLAPEFDIELLVHANHATPEALAELDSRGIRVRTAPSFIPAKSGWAFPLKLAGNLLFSSLPYSVASHKHAGYAEALQAAVLNEPPDLIHCEWTPYAVYLKGARKPVVIAAHNVEAHIWERLAEAAAGTPRGLVFGIQAKRMTAFEHWAFSSADWVTAVSEGDAQVIRGAGAGSVTVVPNGVDLEYFAPQVADEAEENLLVFTGSMDWHPNQDAVRWFIESVHPVLSDLTTYRLVVVGRNPPSWLLDPARIPAEISVTGTVDDVRPYMARAQVYVTPLRAGGGSRLKILEAFSMKKAVVSTPVGAEGLNVQEGKHFVSAQSADDFAHAVADLLQDGPRRRALGEAGRKLVENQYGWKSIARIQGDLWRRAAGGGA